jgi:hypothetical protein
MSVLSLAAAHEPTLADLIDESLAAALEGERVACLWCGAAAEPALADRFTGQVVVRCTACGAELEGLQARHVREACA